MTDKNSEQKRGEYLASSSSSETGVYTADLNFPDAEDVQSPIDGMGEINPHEEGIEVTDSTQIGESLNPFTSEEDTSSGDDDDEYTVDDDYHSTTEPPTDLKSTIRNISWPDSTHFHADESILLAGNPNIFKSLDRYIAGGLISIIGVFLIGHYLSGATNEFLQTGLPFGIQMYATEYYVLGVFLVILLGLAIIAWAHIERLHTWYFVTNQRSWVRAGVFTQRDLGSLDHENVNNVEQKDPFPMNRFDVGHVSVFTASTDGSELKFAYVKNPTEWKAQIRDCRKIARSKYTTRRDRMDDV